MIGYLAARLAVMISPVLMISPLVAGASALAPASALPPPSTGFGTSSAPVTLSSVSCPSTSFCMAVGTYQDPGGMNRSFSEEWNGSGWRVEPAFGLGFTSVSCTGPSFCIAVGNAAIDEVQFAFTVGQVWNGTSWKPIPPGGDWNSVSCVTPTFCMATSESGLGGTSEWNGTMFHSKAAPLPGCSGNPISGSCYAQLNSVSCPSTSFCAAIGTVVNGPVRPVVFTWTGGAKWHYVPTTLPDSATLTAISCASSTSCLAVGSDGTALELAGTTWTEQDAPTTASLDSVSCPADGNCMVTEPGRVLSRISGTWGTEPAVAAPALSSIGLGDISCTNPTACVAVGQYQAPRGADFTLAEQWNGASWQLLTTRTPSDLNDGLASVSCVTARWCMAVGAFMTAGDVQQTLAEWWDGHTWRVLTSPDAGDQGDYLAGVSCTSRRHCVAVGGFDNASGHEQVLAEVYDGIRWKLVPAPDPEPDDQLASVSCVPVGDCMAVGRSWLARQTDTLAETWNGASWQVTSTPDPGSTGVPFPANYNVLSGVSCVTSSRCVAVGYQAEFEATFPLVIGWDGNSWTQQRRGNLGGGALTSVSCVGAGNCVATGWYGRDLPVAPAAESWNGKAWVGSRRPAGLSGREASAGFNAVACTGPTACLAVGGTEWGPSAIGVPATLAENIQAWNGRGWTKFQLTSLSSFFSELNGISCTGPKNCVAVGEVSLQRTMAAIWNGTSWLAMNARNP